MKKIIEGILLISVLGVYTLLWCEMTQGVAFGEIVASEALQRQTKPHYGEFYIIRQGGGYINLAECLKDGSKCYESIDSYSVKEICQAIYFAEGGAKACQPYGIKGVHCGTRSNCERRCKKIVKRVRNRIKNTKDAGFNEYLQALQSVYCPSGSGAESKGCDNWQANVRYFLSNPRKI